MYEIVLLGLQSPLHYAFSCSWTKAVFLHRLHGGIVDVANGEKGLRLSPCFMPLLLLE